MKQKESNNPSIDIIIPVYNVSRYLPLCLESVAKQTYSRINVYLIDDGSTDNSGAICDQFCKKYSKFNVIHQRNMGLSGARNTGIEVSKSDYICFLDSDDWIDTNSIEILMKAILQTDSDLARCKPIDEFTDQGKIETYQYPIHWKVYDRDEIIVRYLKRKFNTSAWGKVYRRELFKDLRFPVGKLHEDMAIMIDILERCDKVVNIDATLWHYRQRPGSITKQHYKHANFDLYMNLMHIKEVIGEKYKMEYEGFYAFYIKSLLKMFTNEDKKQFNKDYAFLSEELNKYRYKSLLNPTLGLKDKISILLVNTPVHNITKNIYRKLKNVI